MDFRSALHPPGRLPGHPASGARPATARRFHLQRAASARLPVGAGGHGLRAPDDLALICFNGTQQSEFSVPPLSAVEQPIDAMAKRAIAMLAAGAAPAELHEFAFQLRIRRSCGC
ncbi:substrate-binding domain-containing protein [Serratia ureilytica]